MLITGALLYSKCNYTDILSFFFMVVRKGTFFSLSTNKKLYLKETAYY